MEMPVTISGLILRVARDGVLRAAGRAPRSIAGRSYAKDRVGRRVYSVAEPDSDPRAQSLTDG
jgi:hypothetical protein